MKFPRAGRFRDRVQIQSRATAKDDYNGPKDDWVDIADGNRRCDIEHLNGKEYFASQAEHNSITTRIRFRYSKSLFAKLKTKNRLIDKRVSPRRVYDIESAIVPQNIGTEIICMCVERT